MEKIFDTDRRIRLGVWGLGRGGGLAQVAKNFNLDVVAGCDINPLMCERFKAACPEALVTADENEFLAQDMDAVLIATFFMDHAKQSIRALERGFHVMCEVTSFFTPAEGVALVEAVQQSGKVYNLLENYPFSKENLYLADLWKKGFFGEFMYGEIDYFHECRRLHYSYNSLGKTVPVEPGYSAHSWRSWFNGHYYCTHSLGPLMKITGLRPEKVTAFPEKIQLPGYLPGKGQPCPSMIQMSNGAIMRNLCGAATGDYHTGRRLWGTRASAESLTHGLFLQVGAAGSGLKMKVNPEWPELGELAERTGHGGGDFWELYYFAREVLTGEPAPWTIFDACDVTLAGIMAVRSQAEGGTVKDIPDFRKPEVREQYRHDEGRQPALDVTKLFPEGHDKTITSRFAGLMCDLDRTSTLLRRAVDGARIFQQLANDEDRLRVIRTLRQCQGEVDHLMGYRKEAKTLIDRYPGCLATHALETLLTVTDEECQQGSEKLADMLQGMMEDLLKA